MVDKPSNKSFIVILSFLGIYATVLSFLPTALLSEELNQRSPLFPDGYWQLSDIEDLISTSYNITCGDGDNYFWDKWGTGAEAFGHNFLFRGNIIEDRIRLSNDHYTVFAIFEHGYHGMHWVAKSTGEDYGSYLYQEELDEVIVYDAENDVEYASFTVKCDHVTMHNVIAYNSSLYENATDAFNNQELMLEFAIEWDELGTGLNAWNMISSILFFQNPDIHYTINAILAIPLWACISFLAFCFTLVVIDVLPF